MASASRLPVGTLSAVAVTSAALATFSSRHLIAGFLTGPGSYSRIFALAVVLANFKNFPFVWHIRVWNSILRHFLFDRRQFTPATTGLDTEHPAIFRYTVTPSASPLTECDYNMHKSNSTYFSDLDITRSHVVSALFSKGIKAIQDNPGRITAPDGKPAKGKWFIMLGAVECSFKREIKPYERYEMWSRMLCWDRKWLYIVTHFVKAGTVRPDGYTFGADGRGFLARLTSRSKKPAKKSTAELNGSAAAADPLSPAIPHKALFATAVSKYVMKVGRLTIHPEAVIDASGLLPPRPGGWKTMSGGKEAAPNGHAAVPNADLKWDYERIEAENARGLKYAEHFAALDDLHQEFTGDSRPVLGVYGDLF